MGMPIRAKVKISTVRKEDEVNRIIKTLIRRDGMTEKEARSYFEECREEFMEMLERDKMPDSALMDYFGLEDDYIEEFLFG